MFFPVFSYILSNIFSFMHIFVDYNLCNMYIYISFNVYPNFFQVFCCCFFLFFSLDTSTSTSFRSTPFRISSSPLEGELLSFTEVLSETQWMHPVSATSPVSVSVAPCLLIGLIGHPGWNRMENQQTSGPKTIKHLSFFHFFWGGVW